MRFGTLGAAALAVVLALPALAQTPQGPSVNVRGTIATLDGQKLVVASREGPQVAITLPAAVTISADERKTLADIKPGDFIGTTAVPGIDGKLHATEVHIFPEALRGTGDGHRPYDFAPGSTMTNGTVEGFATMAQGGHLVVKSKDSTTEVEVAADTPIVTPVPADRSLLKPGAAVVVAAIRQPDGSLVARRITAEKDGVKPVG